MNDLRGPLAVTCLMVYRQLQVNHVTAEVTLRASFSFEMYMKFMIKNYNVICRGGGAGITLAQVYRIQRELD